MSGLMLSLFHVDNADLPKYAECLARVRAREMRTFGTLSRCSDSNGAKKSSAKCSVLSLTSLADRMQSQSSTNLQTTQQRTADH